VLAIIAELSVLATFVEQTPETAVEKSIVIGEPVEVKETCPQAFTPSSKSDNTVINFLKDLRPKKELVILFVDIKIVLNTSANKQFLAKHLIKFRLSVYYF
jgi:hypothetical protein